jgi:NAD(P)-dependent dehydrogenase (short-subunit alcohol dehydrogenase family)
VQEPIEPLDLLEQQTRAVGVQQRKHQRLGGNDVEMIWRQVEDEVALNLTALINVTHAALPLLQRSTQAAIVNVGSGTDLLPKPNGLVYSATKAPSTVSQSGCAGSWPMPASASSNTFHLLLTLR